MKKAIFTDTIRLTAALAVLAATQPAAAESAEDYPGVTLGDQTAAMYLSPLWSVDGLDLPDGGDACQSMAVAGGFVYLSDSSDPGVRKLRRYDRDTGERAADLRISYPAGMEAPEGALSHAGTDDDGTLYVWTELPDGSSPVMDIDIVDPSSGEVTRRISHDLGAILPERYININSVHLGHPQVTGSLSDGDYELAVTETFSNAGEDALGIRLWRIPMSGGVADDPRASKLLLPSDESGGRIDAFIPVDGNARVAVIDGSKSVVDDGLNPPMYFRVRNLGVSVNSRLTASDGTSPDPRANGVTIFHRGGHRLVVYGNRMTGRSDFAVAYWKDTSSGIDGGNIEKLWTFPAGGFGVPTGGKPATLSAALPHAGDDSRVDIYVYSSGGGLGAYAIGDTRYSGTTDLSELKADRPAVSLRGSTVSLSEPAAIEVLSVDGRRVMRAGASTSHDLSRLPRGVYLVKVAGTVLKALIP